jgi:hypothetical protein
MKFASLYLVGYVIFVIGIGAALWKMGVLQRIGAGWTAIGVIIAIGLGIMFSITGSGDKKTIEIDRQ